MRRRKTRIIIKGKAGESEEVLC
jgi:hypothetical protein